ncbi:MAG: hypothetical protein GX567_04840 [Clostridia bacterium]|nr:hypothetical protein [Clostridia bacterium]
MNKINKLKERISRILRSEENRVNQEIEEFRQKQYDNSICYGCGGFYNRYEKAIASRYAYLDDLDSLKKANSQAVLVDTLTLHAYYCPTCSQHVFTELSSPETVYCPLCERKIWRDGRYTKWDIVKDSKFTEFRAA